ncbi:MAG: SAM hydrolase/SAM-dependent halogenase family protein, partial [Candidatus Binatia bacterium]
MTRRIISLLTDFGSRDAFVGIMKGVILGINPDALLVDLSHEVPAQDVLGGALVLRSAAPFFPSETIHVAVVDPGVGSARRGILIATQHGSFIGPDNGLLSLAVPAETVTRITHLTNTEYFLSPCSSTFHGRDVFAPVAAHLSLGITAEQFGPEAGTMERLTFPEVERREKLLVGRVIYIDHFGNLVTNITEADLLPFPREKLCVSIRSVHIQGVVASYTAVDIGTPAALINSW